MPEPYETDSKTMNVKAENLRLILITIFNRIVKIRNIPEQHETAEELFYTKYVGD